MSSTVRDMLAFIGLMIFVFALTTVFSVSAVLAMLTRKAQADSSGGTLQTRRPAAGQKAAPAV